MKISLKQFVLEGAFGPITIGDSINKLKDFFGMPNHALNSKDGGILFYGDYEFHYKTNSNRIYLIQNASLQASHNNKNSLYLNSKKTTINPWFLKPKTDYNYGYVITFLKNENIVFQEIKQTKYKSVIISFPSGVYLDISAGWSGFGGNKEDGSDHKSFDIKVNKLNEYILNGIRLESNN